MLRSTDEVKNLCRYVIWNEEPRKCLFNRNTAGDVSKASNQQRSDARHCRSHSSQEWKNMDVKQFLKITQEYAARLSTSVASSRGNSHDTGSMSPTEKTRPCLLGGERERKAP